MQIVIDIDNNLYTRLFDNKDIDAVDMLKACVAIRKGTLLPKNHGNLIDVNALEADLIEPIYYPDGDVIIDGYGYSREQIKEAPIIIEAYKEEENADSN